MKNQNLDNNRDLLKCDLACRIVREGLVQVLQDCTREHGEKSK